jgi:predicted amidohydrolase YtcJ
MTMEILYLTTQMQRWLNSQVARHLEAQAARLSPELGAEGPGGSVGLDRRGLPEGYLVDQTETIDAIHAAAARDPVAQAATLTR